MIIRIILFSGLIIHKLIWEVWKRKYPSGDRSKVDPRVSLPNSAATNVVSQRLPRGAFKKVIKLCKIGFLLFLLVQSLFLNVLPIENPPSFLQYAGLALFLSGLCISIAARIRLGQNWTDLEDRKVLPGQVLVQSGIYRYIRHPIYAGDVLLITGLELALNSWLFVLGILIAVVVIRNALQEEALLANAFPEYAEYCLRTKRFLPFVI